MEIWLNTDKTQFRLPVLPATFKINGSIIESSVNLLNIGEANIYGGNNTQDIEISSHFPYYDYWYVQYRPFKDPLECVAILRNWMNNGQTVRLVVPSIANFPVRITNFEYEKKNNKDIYYTMKLKEVRSVVIKKLSDSNNSSNTTNNSKPNNETTDKNNSNKQKVHIVVKGDNLWDIAQKYYGKGSDYPKIKKANENTYPRLKDPANNFIDAGWKLVIP